MTPAVDWYGIVPPDPPARFVAVVLIPVILALIVPATLMLPATYKFCPMPTPPNTVKSPELVFPLLTAPPTNLMAPVLNVPYDVPVNTPPLSVPLSNHSK